MQTTKNRIDDAITNERFFTAQTLILDQKEPVTASTLQIACSKFPRLALLLIENRDEYDFSKPCYIGFNDEAFKQAILKNDYTLVENGFINHFPELDVRSEFFCGKKKLLSFLYFAVQKAMMKVVSSFFENYEFLKQKNIYRTCFIHALRCKNFATFEPAVEYFIDRMNFVFKFPDLKKADLLQEIQRELLSKEELLYHLLSETDDDLFLQKCLYISHLTPSLFVSTNFDIHTEKRRRMKNLGLVVVE